MQPSPAAADRLRSSTGSPARERPRRPVAQVSCEACRTRKSKCVFLNGVSTKIVALQQQQPDRITPLTNEERCQRCVNLNLTCTIGINKRRLRHAQKTTTQASGSGSAAPAQTQSPFATASAPVPLAAESLAPLNADSADAEQSDLSTGDALRLRTLVGSSSESPGDYRNPTPQDQQGGSGPGAMTSAGPDHTKALISIASADMLIRCAAFLRNPCSLLAFCLPRVPGYGANLDAARAQQTPVRALLNLIESASRSGIDAEQTLRPVLLFFPHLFSISAVQKHVVATHQPSSCLLLATLYLMTLRLECGSRRSYDSQASHASVCAYIRKLTEDILLEPYAAQDDYAVQALELLAHYHPLATQRAPPAIELVTDVALPTTLGENLLRTAMQSAHHLRYPAKSPAVCSLRRALLMLVPNEVDFVEEYNDLTARQVSTQQSHLDKYTQTQLPRSSNDANIDSVFRQIGTVALVGRTKLAMHRRRVLQQLENRAESRNLSAREEAATQQAELLRSALEQLRVLSEELKSEINSLAKILFSPSQATRESLRSLLLAIDIEVLQMREVLTATATYSIMIAAVRSNERASSLLDVLETAPPGMQVFLGFIAEIRMSDIPHLLALVTALAEVGPAMEAYPAQSLCAIMLVVTHMALEELGARIEGWQSLPAHMHATLILLERAALAVGGWEHLSSSERAEKWKNACADADIRVGAAMIVDAFAKVVRKWRTQGLDRQAFSVKDGDVPRAQAGDEMLASHHASTAVPLSSSVNFAALGGEMNSFMASLFADDNTDWTALFSALQG